MAVEWGEQLPLCGHFYLIPGNCQLILAAHYKEETIGQIWPSTCQHRGSRGLHYAW
jgi:hypothetical protein